MADCAEIVAYAGADYSSSGGGWKTLEQAVTQEAGLKRIKLTDRVGVSPADLTPEMVSWFSTEVAPVRRAALDAVDRILREIGNGRRAGSVFFERRADEIEDTRILDKRRALTEHRQSNAAQIIELEQASEAAGKAQERYEDLEARHNRAPHIPPFWYFPALVLLLPAEGAINFETFRAVEWMTMAIALGTVIVLGFILALSAHLHGTLLRQARVLFDPSQDDVDRLVGWRMLSIGSAGLAVVLGVIWYARAIYFTQIFASSMALGSSEPNSLWIIGGSMLGNVAVWLGGVILAFLVHDPDPHFPKSLLDWKTKQARAKQLQQRLDAALARRFAQIDAVAYREREALTNQIKTIERHPEYVDARRQFARVAEQDARVLALLRTYRNRLLGAMREHEVVFDKWQEVAIPTETESLDATRYAAVTLVLKHT